MEDELEFTGSGLGLMIDEAPSASDSHLLLNVSEENADRSFG